ncbi:hypothetical protein NPIL_625321, partial [Nephila pilipes]
MGGVSELLSNQEGAARGGWV